ncbi:MAG: glycosyltransferase [Firmicutes bacterium]|nr:glycosyltransferase [Bacillota bacterium]
MKVLITTDWFKTATNGVATSVKNLEKGLRECGAEVRILTLSPNYRSYVKGSTTYISSISAGKIYPNARISALVRRKLIKDLIDWKPDIIHSQCEFSTFIMARRIAKRVHCPIVHTYHTIYEDYTHYIIHNKRLGKNAMITFTKQIAKRVNGMIAPTQKVSELLIRYGCHTPIWVMPTGLDLAKIASHSDEVQKAALKEKLGIPQESRVLLYAGRLASEKNIEELITMLGRIRPENAVFLIVGDGPARKDIERCIAENSLDCAIMTGMVKPRDMRFYYGISDIFINASQSETQGLTYIEALANGLPLLCRRDKCLEDVLIDGVTGYAYSNFTEFEVYLNKLLSMDTSQISENAVNMIEQHYSLRHFAEHALKIYTECLNFYEE